jgi:hypothetical protein
MGGLSGRLYVRTSFLCELFFCFCCLDGRCEGSIGMNGHRVDLLCGIDCVS